MKLIIYLTLPLVLLASCRSATDLTASKPIVDTQGVNIAQYEGDLAQCEVFSDEVALAQKAAAGAVSGAVIGGVLGAVIGNSSTAAKGAGVGAIGGGARGLGSGIRQRDRVIRLCLIGRGYRVLN